MKLRTIFGLGELKDLLVSSGLLISELVARECQNFEAPILEFIMDLNQLSVVLVCQSSLGGNVDDHVELFTLHEVFNFLNLLTCDQSDRNFVH